MQMSEVMTLLTSVSLYTPWSEAEVLSHLATGWGEGAISELKLEYLYGPDTDIPLHGAIAEHK